jgi:WD40 repeat protein
VRVWNRDSPDEVASWGYQGVVTSIAMSSDGAWVVTGGDDGTVRLKRPGNGEGPQLWPAHHGAIKQVAMSSDGLWVVSAGEDGTLRLWNQELLGSEPQGWWLLQDSVNSVALSREARWLVSGGQLGAVRVWDREHPCTWLMPFAAYAQGWS